MRGQLEPVQWQHRDVHRGQQRRVIRLGQYVLAVGPGYVPGQGFPAPDRVERDEHRARERAPAEQEGEFGHVVGEHTDELVSLHLADTAHLTLALPAPEALTDSQQVIVDALAGGGAFFFRTLSDAVGSTDDEALLADLWALVWSGRIISGANCYDCIKRYISNRATADLLI